MPSAARAFARAGAKVFLAGRTLAKLEVVARDIASAGGIAETAQLDVLDQAAVEKHVDAVAAKAGGIDIALNAVGMVHVQGTLLADLSLKDFSYPIETYTRFNFITAKAVARHMVKKGSGVILTLSTPGSKLTVPGVLGFCSTCAAIEAFSRVLAAELGSKGVRVICLRPDAIPQAQSKGTHAREVFAPMAAAAGISVEAMLEGGSAHTLLGRFPTLDQVGNAAVFFASDHAGAMTGTVANLTCGSLTD